MKLTLLKISSGVEAKTLGGDLKVNQFEFQL